MPSTATDKVVNQYATNDSRMTLTDMEHPERSYPDPVVGFSVAYRLSDLELQRWSAAHSSILAGFPWLHSLEIRRGATCLLIWGHFSPETATYTASTGDLWVLIGSPFGRHSWQEVLQRFNHEKDNGNFEMPWEGRCALLRISPDGQIWQMWNDWAAALPVFCASWKDGGIASCLEPVVVEVREFTSAQLSKRGLVELLLLGQFLDTDTLYKPMQVLPPDSHVIWRQGKLETTRRLWTVQASDAHFSTPRPLLVDTLYDLTCRAVSEALISEEAPILLPLSSGMDSRLIACVAAENHLQVEAYSYGPKEWAEVHFAKQIAEALNIPWQRVDLGTDYRADFIRPWLNWFGSSLHAHGMYQFPFLRCIEGKRGLIPNGFYGNNMAGGNHPNDCLFEQGKLLDRFCGYGTCWDKESLADLLDFDPMPFYLEMDALLQEQVTLVSNWSEYQQMNVIDMWNRQARFIFYQPTMYSYFGLERSPFMHRDYARFCLSLSPELLKKRELQIEMLDKYWPQLGRIGGTFRPLYGMERVWHSARYHVVERLPKSLRPLMGATWLNRMDLDCAAMRKWDNFTPVSSNLTDIGPFRAKPIMEAAKRAISGSPEDLAKVAAVQPVLFRLLNGV